MNGFNKLIKGVLVFLLYILVPYVIDMFLPSITMSSTLELFYRFIFMFLLLLFFVFIYKDDIVKDIKALKNNFGKILGKSVIYFAVMLVGFFAISALIYAVHPSFTYTNSEIIGTLLKKNFPLMIWYVFGISLFMEQIVFRKVFRDIIGNKYFFVIFSSVIYGIFQVGYTINSLNDLFTIIPFAFAGIILCVSYEKTDNILTPCLVYLFYDLFSLITNLL